MFDCFLRSRHLCVCQPPHTLKTTFVDVGFHLNFDLGWEGRGLVSGSLLFGGTFVLQFLGGLAVVFFGILRGQITLIFFTFFLIFFLLFKSFFFISFFYSVLW